jgi:hypothetical protein
MEELINSLIIMTILFYKIPSRSLFQREEQYPLFGKKGVKGDFVIHVNSILRPLIN